LNRPLKFFQRSFVTAIFLPLAVIGICLIAARRQWFKLIILLIVPVYYATVQALVHTEYRYVLATPHMLMIPAAVGICWLVGSVARGVRRD
jgi:hypothetical protein